MRAPATPPPPHPSPWAVEFGAGLPALDALAPEWLALWRERGPAATPFEHPAWIRAHVAAMESPRRLLLLCARRDGRLRAVLPLIRDRAWYYGLPARRLRSAAGVFAVRFDLCAPSGEEGRQAVAALSHALLRLPGWDVVELREIPAGAAAAQLPQAAAARGLATGSWNAGRSPILELDPAGQWERNLSSHDRYELRRRRRRLEETAQPGGAGLRLCSPALADHSQILAQLEQYYRLEADGWKGRQGSDILSRPGARAFYDQACTAMAEAGLLALHRLELDGRLLAMSCGLRLGSAFYVLKWSYDEAYAKYGVGQLLVQSVLQDCAVTGITHFDFTGADDAYKLRWTKVSLPHDWLFIFRSGLYGRSLRSLKCRWAPRVRHWLERKRAPHQSPLV